MKIISFSWTTPALLAGEKTVTRRDWKERHATAFHEGDLVQAWDKVPFAGGKKIAIIRLTQRPYLEDISGAWNSDYWAEGFNYMTREGIAFPDKGAPVSGIPDFPAWLRWKATGVSLWVVRFKLESVEGAT